MKYLAGIIALAFERRSVLGAVPVWGQCGGNDYTGEKGEPSFAWLAFSLFYDDI